jgi:CHAD domain-containing protein
MMQEFAVEQAGKLLKRLHAQIDRAAEKGDPDSIHDLRVAIRRFTQCLRIFPEFFPRPKARKTRKRLKGIMNLAAEVRDRDIALELLRAAGPTADQGQRARLEREREKADEALLAEIRRTRKKRLEI